MAKLLNVLLLHGKELHMALPNNPPPLPHWQPSLSLVFPPVQHPSLLAGTWEGETTLKRLMTISRAN